MSTPHLIDRILLRQVAVPLEPALQSAAGEVRTMPMLLIDVTDGDGASGYSYLLCYAKAAAAAAHAYASGVAETLVGAPAAPRAATEALNRRLRVLGQTGTAAWVLGGIDMALWDLAARRAGEPLSRILGAEPIPIRAYASLRSAEPMRLAGEAESAALEGFEAFKVKVGHGPVELDLAAAAAVRDGAGQQATVMVDYNQSLTVPEAIVRARALADVGVTWIEEPIAAHDASGHARIAAATPVPIQLGENWQGPAEAAAAFALQASDLAMLDAMNIGGVTGWLAAAALADAAGRPVSSHLFCEISAHLLAATPGRHWLEWLDVAGPLLKDAIKPTHGRLTADDRPGSGVEWDEDAVQRYLY